jgi:peptide/nickel transport system ATP-binding protein
VALLDVQDLSVEFAGRGRWLRAVERVSFAVAEAEVMGLVGESGSGKTVACRAILRLLDGPNVRTPTGEARFEGQDLLRLSARELRQLYGRRIAMIFQNPSSYLDPLMSVGRQVAEPLVHHEGLSSREARARAIELLRQVGIPDPGHTAQAYPHQLSGGMRQRAMIAAAIACEPRLLVADEPTTALDVTVQAQILRLLLDLRDRTGLAIILITHALGVVAATCDSVAVMYAGRIMERASKRELIRQPKHPYTRGLLRSQPDLVVAGDELPSIEGQLPALDQLPAGCRFHPRCPDARPACGRREVDLEPAGADHRVACIRWRELEAGA